MKCNKMVHCVGRPARVRVGDFWHNLKIGDDGVQLSVYTIHTSSRHIRYILDVYTKHTLRHIRFYILDSLQFCVKLDHVFTWSQHHIVNNKLTNLQDTSLCQ